MLGFFAGNGALLTAILYSTSAARSRWSVGNPEGCPHGTFQGAERVRGRRKPEGFPSRLVAFGLMVFLFRFLFLFGAAHAL